MSMDTSGLPLAKPEPRKKQKAREDRHEAAIKKVVRAKVAERDGFCRAQATGMGACVGYSEWAHFGVHKRYRTRGQAPEVRHTTAGTLMLCTGHHYEYDKGLLDIAAKTDRECDGPLRYEREGRVYEEVEAA